MYTISGNRFYLVNVGNNIWSYNTSNGDRKQVTSFTDYDVKWPSIGPGERGRGEIVFQLGSQIQLLNLRNGRVTPVEIIIPGDRPALRPQPIDYSEFINTDQEG